MSPYGRDEATVAPVARHVLAMLERHGIRGSELSAAVEALYGALAAGQHCVSVEGLAQATGMDPDNIRRALSASGAVGSANEHRPLILDGGHLYLQRFWDYEQALAARLREVADYQLEPDPALLGRIDDFCPGGENGAAQRQAMETALSRSLCVITGGPGTGKTSTAARIVALLTHGGQPPRLALAAPTGKAAARLKEAVLRELSDLREQGRLDLDAQEVEQLCGQSGTLQRLLGWLPDRVDFRHNRVNPLPQELLIVDEVSMVDLPLMAKLMEAVDPARTRVLLLGDAEQLPSVQARNVLADILAAADAWGPMAGACCRLDYNWRARRNPALAGMIDACRRGDSAALLDAFEAGSAGRLHSSTTQDNLVALVQAPLMDLADAVRNAPDPQAALRSLERFRILCALRQGPFGSERVNQLATQLLRERGLAGRGELYHGLPLIITRNDYDTRLFNGDVVLLLRQEGQLMAWAQTERGLDAISPARLPPHEPAYALTVHRSQGSEFDRVLLVAGRQDNPLLTRELIYTGLSRARHGADFACTPTLLRTALGRRVERVSGLPTRLR